MAAWGWLTRGQDVSNKGDSEKRFDQHGSIGGALAVKAALTREAVTMAAATRSMPMPMPVLKDM